MQQAVGAEVVGVGVAGAFAAEHADAAAGAGALAGGFHDLLVHAQRGGSDRLEVKIGVVAAGRSASPRQRSSSRSVMSEFLKKIALVALARGSGRIGHRMLQFTPKSERRRAVSGGPVPLLVRGISYSSAAAIHRANSSHEEDPRRRSAVDGVCNPGVRYHGTPPSPSPPPSRTITPKNLAWPRSSTTAGTGMRCRDLFRQNRPSTEASVAKSPAQEHGKVPAMTDLDDLRFPIGRFSPPASSEAGRSRGAN